MLSSATLSVKADNVWQTNGIGQTMWQMPLRADCMGNTVGNAQTCTVKGNSSHTGRDLHAGLGFQIATIYIALIQTLEYQFCRFGRITA